MGCSSFPMDGKSLFKRRWNIWWLNRWRSANISQSHLRAVSFLRNYNFQARIFIDFKQSCYPSSFLISTWAPTPQQPSGEAEFAVIADVWRGGDEFVLNRWVFFVSFSHTRNYDIIMPSYLWVSIRCFFNPSFSCLQCPVCHVVRFGVTQNDHELCLSLSHFARMIPPDTLSCPLV